MEFKPLEKAPVIAGSTNRNKKQIQYMAKTDVVAAGAVKKSRGKKPLTPEQIARQEKIAARAAACGMTTAEYKAACCEYEMDHDIILDIKIAALQKLKANKTSAPQDQL